jgi:predicted nucleic acid-binding protein
VYQELLQGTKTEKEFRELKAYLNDLTFYDLRNGRKSYEEAAMLYAKCKKSGITIRGTIDVIIAQIAIENHLHLLHDDKDYVNMTKVVKELRLIP